MEDMRSRDIQAKLVRLLRWSEKYTKTDMVYLTHGGFWLTGAQVITTLVSFGASIAFGYFIPKDVYGTYRYILSAAALLGALTLTGLNTAIIQSVARGFEGSLRDGFRLSMRWSWIAVGAALIGSVYYAYHANYILAISYLLIAFTSPLLYSSGLFGSFINGKKDFARLSCYTVIDNVVPTLAVLGTLFFTHHVVALVAAYFVSSTLMGWLLYRRTLALYQPSATHDPELARYSIKLSALNILAIATAQADKIIVFTALGSVELAIYTFATAFPDQIRSVLKNLNTLMIPRFSERDSALHSFALRRKVFQLSIILIVITFAYIAIAPLLYHVFFPKYDESILYSQLLGLSIFSAIAMIPSSLLIAKKREKELAFTSVIGSIIQLGVLFPAVYYWGITGVIVARVLTTYINTVLTFWMLRKVVHTIRTTETP